ncbi:unnamed protein product, partial [Lymnaea stagnalis]
RDFDLRYTAAAATSKDHKTFTEASGERRSLEFNSTWMRTVIGKFFEGNETAISLGLDELTSTIYDVLNSGRKDEELQNELFDLLGFDRFELIQQLLVNRNNIIKAHMAESTRAILQQMPKKKSENERPTYGCQVMVQVIKFVK